MSSPSVNSSLHPARLAGALAISILFAGCVTGAGGAGSSTPGESPSASTSGSPSAGPSGSSSANGFYLRVWQTQALAPQNMFDWLPVVTISDGKFIDGRVAVPAIYPGPLWIGLSVRTISAKGIDAIVAEARKQGLLDTKVDFADQAVPGAVLGHIQLIVDGKTYDLTGDPDALTRCRCIPAPGSSAAYAAFWQELSDLDAWLPAELGSSAPYEPERVAVLAAPPSEPASGITPNEVAWPLSMPFSAFGTALGNDGSRCGVVSGADLAKLMPVIQAQNQLTRFVDSAKVKDSLKVRVLVPGEEGPCA
jgi:hypothetical protein